MRKKLGLFMGMALIGAAQGMGGPGLPELQKPKGKLKLIWNDGSGPLPKGLKKYLIDGEEFIAINKANALKKHAKKYPHHLKTPDVELID